MHRVSSVSFMMSQFATAQQFMSKKLVLGYASSNVSWAVKSMVEYGIGSVIVEDAGQPVGIFTERDLLSKVLARHRKLEEPVLTEVMTPAFNILSPDATLGDAAKIMREKKGRLVVFDNQKPIGIITATDIVREIGKFGRRFDFKSAYSGIVYEEGPRSPVELIVQLMDKRRVGSVIISEGRFSRGIFTERDLLRSILTSEFTMSSSVENYSTHYLITAEEEITVWMLRK